MSVRDADPPKSEPPSSRLAVQHTASVLEEPPVAPQATPHELAEPTDRIEQRFEVRFEYPVVFTRDVFAPYNDALAWAMSRAEPQRRHRALVVVDGGVASAWPGLSAKIERYFDAHAGTLELADEPLGVQGGEAIKNDPLLFERMLDAFAKHRLDRHACVVIVGGGSVIDAVGYAAAVCHRGLRVVRLPTTVLAQDDAGIGVKNGINHSGQKNFSGTFWPPHAVLNDFSWLRTLPARDFVSGYAEAVKVALIRDASFFAWLEAHADLLAARHAESSETLIRRCAALHLRHIRDSGDAFELGSARPLDFGHWSAHKLERLSNHELRHGEAVSIGIALDVEYCARAGRLAPAERDRIHALLRALGLPLHHRALLARDALGKLRVLGGLDDFREHLGGELTVTLLHGIGRSFDAHELDAQLLTDSIEALANA